MITKSVSLSALAIAASALLGAAALAAAPFHPAPTSPPAQAAGARTPPASNAGNGHGHAEDIMTFDTMYGVDGPFIGEVNAVRGVVGDEAPWAVESVRGSLDTNGRLRIKVRGLVFKADPRVPPDLVGKNDETQFRGLVSCLTEGDTTTPTVNVATQGFAATTSGDSTIDAVVALPNPCVAPVVMILAGSEDKWFAITGFEKEGS